MIPVDADAVDGDNDECLFPVAVMGHMGKPMVDETF